MSEDWAAWDRQVAQFYRAIEQVPERHRRQSYHAMGVPVAWSSTVGQPAVYAYQHTWEPFKKPKFWKTLWWDIEDKFIDFRVWLARKIGGGYV